MNPAEAGDLLACAALDPALGGLLFLDAGGRTLDRYAASLATAMTVAGEPRPAVVHLDSASSEEELWPHWAVAFRGGALFARAAGRLSEAPDAPPPVIVVPDLARVGSAVLRAAVATLGADVVHVERHGISERWRPAARWVVGCARRDVPMLSPHLLDRFPIRCAGPYRGEPEVRAVDPAARQARPRTPPAVVEMIARTMPAPASTRRCLALARTARALARLRHGQTVREADVVRAAELFGLSPARPASAPPAVEPAPPARLPAAASLGEPPSVVDGPDELAELPASSEAQPARPADLEPARRYPEDDEEAVPQPYALRWGTPGPAGSRITGTIIGHDPAGSARDLAVVPTLLRALRRSRLRRNAGPLRLARDDLRQNRREQRSRRLLVLVVDHSCRRDWDCTPGLAEHLRWAYDQAAAVSIIELGHRGTAHDLRPEHYRARTVIDPRLPAAFDREPGGATPLAAGLDQAAQELRRSMHRGWAAVDVARLVVVTDGRGNVPLAASASGRVTGPVARQGIDDALAIAAVIARLQRVEARVVAPDLQQYPTLPAELAKAMGGRLTVVADPADLP